jgi:hypothetical protein
MTHALTYVTFFGVTLLSGSRLAAQQPPIHYKVGDRVEVDTMYTPPQMDPSKSTSWRKGTVTEIYSPESRYGGYVIRMDGDRREYRVRFVDPQWIRPAKGEQAGVPPQAPPGANTPGPPTQAAPNPTGTVACPAMDNFSGTSMDASFRRFIAGQYHRNGKSKDRNLPNVTVSVHFSAFKIGTTHPYRRMVANPDGDGAVDGTTIYPVKTTYVVCSDYPGFAPTGNRGQIMNVNYENMTYSCFKDDTGDWRCNQTGGFQDRPQFINK